ncbi:IS110 family transposase [Actinoplanes sp. TRM 88003]|uniref:IS110 family transposase n=1 Tax=Paractinoplanes aksuensis TaxID=2939490 RepID=A0ABT1E4K3_9ACTN|nr:IS110 family transposase [Actinoplanes aksuensis]MCO8278072.1 IS110 family transposase [Actinoplanes aksuensis]
MSHPPVTSQPDTTAEVVLGVDTHKEFHVAALVSVLGVVLAWHRFSATAAGYRQLLAWAGGFGVVRRAGIEGSHSYGAALTRHLQAAGLEVIEVSQPDRAERRRRGKTDVLDAEAAARAVLSGRAGAVAKTSTGPVEMIRMFKLAKASAVKSRTQTINQLKAVLVGAEPSLREPLAGLSNPKLFRACAQLDAGTPIDTSTATTYTLRLLARRITALSAEITDLDRRITDAVHACRPALLDRHGVGPDTAAALLLAAGDNPHRLTSEAGFAALCGVNPIEVSSGKNSRRRLNRGGDRQANSALYTVAVTRLRWDQRTRDYVERRVTEGKTRREAIRCLKRYIARELYQLIAPAAPTPA